MIRRRIRQKYIPNLTGSFSLGTTSDRYDISVETNPGRCPHIPQISAPRCQKLRLMSATLQRITESVYISKPTVARIIKGFLPYRSLSGPKYSRLKIGGIFNRIV